MGLRVDANALPNPLTLGDVAIGEPGASSLSLVRFRVRVGVRVRVRVRIGVRVRLTCVRSPPGTRALPEGPVVEGEERCTKPQHLKRAVLPSSAVNAPTTLCRSN